MGEVSKCVCGRPPTVNCVGWNSLSDSEYPVKKTTCEKHQTEKAKK